MQDLNVEREHFPELLCPKQRPECKGCVSSDDVLVADLHEQRKIILDGFFFLPLGNSERPVEVLEGLIVYLAALCPECVDVEVHEGEESVVLDSLW